MIRKYSKWFVGLIILAFILPFLMRLYPFGGYAPARETQTVEPAARPLPTVAFNSDTAYALTEKIVSFGPRVSTGSKGYVPARNWIIAQFKRLGADVIEQKFKAQSYKGKPIDGTNIIARYNPSNPDRVVLAVHWDSRDVADQDKDRPNEPIIGADDSGSGMGILMEIARQLQQKPPAVGVDIVFFDAEDLGEINSEDKGWCIGSKYWAAHLHVTGYKAKYGILLDMAGAVNARFARDQLSIQFAPQVADNVWKIGRQLGYVNFFVEEQIGMMTDDHKYVNEIAHIPMVDIINTQPNGHFGAYWHTHLDDNMNLIDRETMRAVGKTLLTVVATEQPAL